SPMPTPAPPAPTSSTAPEPTPTAEPTQTPPPLPPEAGTGDAVGAEAFIRHFFDVSNYAYLSGETVGLRALSDPGCNTCNDMISYFDDVTGSGGRLEGGEVSVLGLTAVDPGPDGRVVARFMMTQDEIRPFASDGRAEATTPATGEVSLQMAVEWDGESWRAMEIAR
ncbi:DUF6318 family protein, partial [Pseudokineococcus sp. 1T1Z-3]|uniref:DUF6318 family protein n=1 Tax=Pseudokineococcus sp. 1T1Z-3 TaxID=3132745 RepID=UPI0030A8C655